MTAATAIPWERIDTLFLDAGNTLVSVDFAWVRDELETLGIACRTEELRRAEAAARPMISSAFSVRKSGEGPDAVLVYMKTVLAHLPAIRQAGIKAIIVWKPM